MKNEINFKCKRELKTFVDLFHGSKVLLEKSRSDQEGSFFTTMSSLLLTAFTFEAYLNHLGSNKLKIWEIIDRISVRDKYRVFCKEFGIEPDFSKRPYQTFKLLFDFRNQIAHGRSIMLKVSKSISIEDNPWENDPKASWEEFCSEKNADRAREDIELMIKKLNESGGEGDFPFIGGVTTGEIKI